MASFERLYNQAVTAGNKNDDGDFEARQMARMAEFIVRRWPNTDDADAAFGVLVSFAIRNGKTDQAEKLLQQASAQSRPKLELLLGNALWGRYLELSQQDQPGPSPDAVAKLKASATKYLNAGFEAAKKESRLSEAGATAVLYLAQAMLSDGNYADAIALLEDEKAGPLALISKKHPTASKPQYAIETYKAALRAYVFISPPQDKKAVRTMQALEKVVKASGDDDAASEQLTRIYIGMGVALQKQMEELRASGKEQEANRVAGATAKFLDRINAQSSEENWPTRVWLAQTYYAMGTNLESATQPERASVASDQPLSKAAREYITKARDAYQKLLSEVAKNPKLAPSKLAVLATRMQLGECYRARPVSTGARYVL